MGCAAKLNIALALRETTRFPPRLRHRDTGNKCIRRCAKSPLKIKTASHCCCAMQLWFIPMFRTGLPESSAPHLRYARQPWFPPQPRHRATGKFSAALALREAAMVSSATSTPGTRDNRIGSCVNSPLKLLCSGGRGRFRGLRPWSASSSAGTWCLRPP